LTGSPHRTGEGTAPGPLDVPFDQYQRYRVTAEIARALEATLEFGHPPSALDVGGYFTDLDGRPRRPICEFLPEWRTVTVDLLHSALDRYVRARGDALPFADASFDLVSSVDVLEHVQPAARPALVAELTRVARHAVLLAAPFRSPLVERAEGIVEDFVERTCGYVQGQLKEHRELGLPDLDTTCQAFGSAGWTIATFPYGNLWRWLFMMLDKHAVEALPGGRPVHRRLDEHYNRSLFGLDREPPSYRHFIVAAREATSPVIRFARDRFARTGGAPGSMAAGPEAAVFELAALHAANLEIQAKGEALRRDTQTSELHEQLRRVRECLEAETAYVDKLERLLRDVERSWAHRLGRALRRLRRGGDEAPPGRA
jgi:hypothetical protein